MDVGKWRKERMRKEEKKKRKREKKREIKAKEYYSLFLMQGVAPHAIAKQNRHPNK